MAEQRPLLKYGEPDSRVLLQEVRKHDRLGRGSNGIIDAVDAHVVIRGVQRVFRMARKLFRGEIEESQLEMIDQVYKVLRQSPAIPTLPTMRRIAGKKEYLLTDLTQQGQRLVLSDNELMRVDAYPESIKPEFLLELGKLDYQNIKTQVFEIAEQAADRGIFIGSTTDAFFLIIEPNQPAQVLLGDLDILLYFDDEKMHERVKAFNQTAATQWLRHVFTSTLVPEDVTDTYYEALRQEKRQQKGGGPDTPPPAS